VVFYDVPDSLQINVKIAVDKVIPHVNITEYLIVTGSIPPAEKIEGIT
jgi:hypothetical protein